MNSFFTILRVLNAINKENFVYIHKYWKMHAKIKFLLILFLSKKNKNIKLDMGLILHYIYVFKNPL